MKQTVFKLLSTFFIVLVVLLPVSAIDGSFTSPYSQITGIGDPFILYDGASEQYYMYCTGGYFKCWVSKDLNTWTAIGHTYAPTDKSFATENFWAPEVYAYNGAYYMVYSAARNIDGQKRHSIGLAKADTPAGPFFDVYNHPLFAPDYSVIDANLLFDDDGKVYLFYSRDCSENTVAGKRTSQIYGIELKTDLSATIGEPVLLATPDTSWELQSGNTRWNEGPCVFKENGVYYLLYSANYYASASYSVGYATASAPLGNYTKAANNPILKGDGIAFSGTGHCNIFRSPDGEELYMIYHAHTNVSNPSGNRKPCIDKIILGEDGLLRVNGPSNVQQPVPSGTEGFFQQYNGVTISSTYTSVLGAPSHLRDRYIAYNSIQEEDIYRFTVTDNGYIHLRFSTPVRLHSILAYGIKYTALSPQSVYAVVNETYKTSVELFSATPMAPAVLAFTSLPHGIMATDIKLYFTAQDAASSMVALSEIVTLVYAEGNESVLQPQRSYTGQFTDVAENTWYHSYVKTAYEYALVNGTSQTAFAPDGKFTVAQALTVAANIHSAYYKESVRSALAGEPWYLPYVEYCVQNGIITDMQFANYNANILRGDMAIVFANILPDSEYMAVRIGSNPDVTTDMPCAPAVSKLYQAGIVSGDAVSGNYRPYDEIVRSEACVIFSRIAVKEYRTK